MPPTAGMDGEMMNRLAHCGNVKSDIYRRPERGACKVPYVALYNEIAFRCIACRAWACHCSQYHPGLPRLSTCPRFERLMRLSSDGRWTNGWRRERRPSNPAVHGDCAVQQAASDSTASSAPNPSRRYSSPTGAASTRRSQTTSWTSNKGRDADAPAFSDPHGDVVILPDRPVVTSWCSIPRERARPIFRPLPS